MKKSIKAFVLLIFMMAFVYSAESQNNKANVENWPETAKKAANAMMEKYGEPHEQTESMLIWHDTAPFIKTVVYKEEIQHDFPMPHKDVLEQFINYNVPADKFDDLAEYDGSVIAERTKGVISARCDKEGANLLALNLAHDIIEGNRNVEEARQYYADAIMKMMQGEKDNYLTDLQFNAPTRNINNPDETVLDMSKVKQMKQQNKN